MEGLLPISNPHDTAGGVATGTAWCACTHGQATARAAAPTRAHDTGAERMTGLGLRLGYLGRVMNLDVATWPQAVGVFLCRNPNFDVAT